MSLFDAFKKKKKVKGAGDKNNGQETISGVDPAQTSGSLGANATENSLAGAVDIYAILKQPHLTEKSHLLVGHNQYVFEIYPKANKAQVRRAVEQLYKVKVISVRIAKTFGKHRRLGRFEGFKSGIKKAVVRLAEGQIIPAAQK